MSVRLTRVPDDRFRSVYVERPSKKGASDAEGGGDTRVQGDSQPDYKMKPNTGRKRASKK